MGVEHLTESEISGFLDDDLTPVERSRVEHHMESCADCRAAVLEVKRAVESAGATPIAAVPRRSARWIAGIGLAAAAVLVAVVALPRDEPTARRDAQRAAPPTAAIETRRAIAVVSPLEGTTIGWGPLTFTWRSVGADLYRFSVTTESGDPVWRGETADTSIVLPATVALVGKKTFYWSVDGVTEGITAATGAHSFRTP